MYQSWVPKNIRVIIVGFVIAFAVGIWIYYTSLRLTPALTLLRLSQSYAFCALILLYWSMFISPFLAVFKTFPAQHLLIKARRALGVSSFGFALAHGGIGFFGTLGGFGGLSYLPVKYILYLSLGLSALLILGLLAFTSVDYAQKKMGIYWQWLHRLVYVAAILVLIHAHALGSHFLDLGAWIPTTLAMFSLILFVLELRRIDIFLAKHNTAFAKMKLARLIGLSAVSLVTLSLSPLAPNTDRSSGVSIHSGHANSQNDTSLIAGIDLTVRQKLGTLTTTYRAVQDTPLVFRIQNLDTQQFIDSQDLSIQKNVFLFVISQDGSDYGLANPQPGPNASFVFDYTFESSKEYIVYLRYQPINEVNQQFVFARRVQSTQPSIAQTPSLMSLFTPTLSVEGNQNTSDFNRGKTKLIFTFSAPIDSDKFELIMYDRGNNFAHVYKNPSANSQTLELVPFATKKSFIPGDYKLYLCDKETRACQYYELNME